MNKNIALSPKLQQVTENLIENLLASDAFLSYQQSQAAMNSDPRARSLLERLSALQGELRHKQISNAVTQSDVDELRTVQGQVQANSAIMAYAQSQQEVVNFLREINAEISQLLGIDFAVLAKQTTC